VVTGRMLHGRLLPHIVRQCGACPDAVGVVVAVGANLRFRIGLRYHNNMRSGRRPRRPSVGLPQMFCVRPLPHCYVGAAGAFVYLRALRVVTRGCGVATTVQKILESAPKRCGGHRGTRLSSPVYPVHTGHAPYCRTTCGSNRRSTVLPVGTRRQFAATISLTRVSNAATGFAPACGVAGAFDPTTAIRRGDRHNPNCHHGSFRIKKDCFF
jgi:hypothetical protein